ncbi:MAG TPA: MerR family transcriptional regulator [Propionibacteriaceae bacterium]
MDALVGIGEFSRLTHLSVKTLRYYHEVTLLVPARIDEQTGYRRYTTDQVNDALLIGRLRDLDLPLAAVRQVVATPAERDAVIADHLQRMERELDRTRNIVGSLRALLTPTTLSVNYLDLVAIPVLSRSARVGRADIADWCGNAFGELAATLTILGIEAAGPVGATYGEEFFTEAHGEVTAYLPVLPGGPVHDTLAGGRFAVARHVGPYRELDRVYGALGSYVAEHNTLAPGPIREIYLHGPPEEPDEDQFQTQVCWPVAS